MSIQIKGINLDLLSYKSKLEKKTPFSDKMVARFHRIIEKANNLYYSESEGPITKIRESILGAKAFGYGMTALIADATEMNNRRKAIMKATGLTKDEIAMDLNELERLRNARKNVKVYGDSIRYGANIRKEWLASIETIFGDADLQALDDFTCLSSLKSIYGDLNLSQVQDSKVDLTGLQVQMVYGDIHAEQAKSTAGLEDLFAVGGIIYYQGKTYKLEEFQELFGQDTKERQM